MAMMSIMAMVCIMAELYIGCCAEISNAEGIDASKKAVLEMVGLLNAKKFLLLIWKLRQARIDNFPVSSSAKSIFQWSVNIFMSHSIAEYVGF